MKQLKFRVWDTLDERFIKCDEGYQGHYVLSLKGEFHNLQNGSGGDEYVVQQYIGLKDKNGVEIYEGDVVKYTDYKEREIISPVTYEPPYFGVLDINNEPAGPNDLYYEQSDAEVIGNIHEGIFKDNAESIQPRI